MMITIYFHIMNLSSWLETLVDPIQQTILGPDWREAPSPRSGRVAKQRELAKRVVAKQQVCEADKERAAQPVTAQPVQAVDCRRIGPNLSIGTNWSCHWCRFLPSWRFPLQAALLRTML